MEEAAGYEGVFLVAAVVCIFVLSVMLGWIFSLNPPSYCNKNGDCITRSAPTQDGLFCHGADDCITPVHTN